MLYLYLCGLYLFDCFSRFALYVLMVLLLVVLLLVVLSWNSLLLSEHILETSVQGKNININEEEERKRESGSLLVSGCIMICADITKAIVWPRYTVLSWQPTNDKWLQINCCVGDLLNFVIKRWDWLKTCGKSMSNCLHISFSPSWPNARIKLASYIALQSEANQMLGSN